MLLAVLATPIGVVYDGMVVRTLLVVSNPAIWLRSAILLRACYHKPCRVPICVRRVWTFEPPETSTFGDPLRWSVVSVRLQQKLVNV